MNRNIEAFFIFCLGLFVFTIGLSNQEIIRFEARFYLFAVEMWRHGLSWFPTTYQQPYPDYPVTGTLFIYLFSKLFGNLNKLTAVLPSAIASAVALAMTYLIGALHNRRWGFFAVCFLLLTAAFITQSRTISLDNYTTAVTTICFYLVYSATLAKKSPSFWLICVLLVVGFAFRGPIGLVIPAGVLCVYYLLEKEFRKLFIIAIASTVLLIACSAVLLGIAYHVGGKGFLQDVLHAEVFNRMEENKTPPFYFYFVESFGAYFISYSLAVVMLIAMRTTLFKAAQPKDFKFLQKCLGWMFVILIGLSIPADKKIRYILPMAPAAALFCAYIFAVPRGQTVLSNLRKMVYWISYFVPAFCFLVVLLSDKKHFILHDVFLGCFFIVMQISVILYHILSRRRDLLVFLTATVSFICAYLGIVEPINLQLNMTRDFVFEVENVRHRQHAQLIFYREDPDGLAIKYIADMSTEEPVLFIKEPAEIIKYKSPAFFIATEQNFQQTPKQIQNSLHLLYRGKIGHIDAVVFSNKNFNKNVFHLRGES
jgi:4-amino-4-deoxy-L-arabinose transferase-like glycosyltransferase